MLDDGTVATVRAPQQPESTPATHHDRLGGGDRETVGDLASLDREGDLGRPQADLAAVRP